MKVNRDPIYMERMRVTDELFQTAQQLMRQNLRRRYPEASEEELEERFLAWVQKRDNPPLAGICDPLSPEEVEARFGPIPDKPIPPPKRRRDDWD